MIYPHVELKYIDDTVGFGVFATQFIPKGTIIYCEDPLDLVIPPKRYQALPTRYQSIVRRLAYIDKTGNYVLCWDIAKHMNHRCECNTLSSAYGIDIALQDIQPGEELTDDYGVFNLEEEMTLSCNCANCRKVLRHTDFDRFYLEWDRRLQDALKSLRSVDQPLRPYINPEGWHSVCDYLDGNTPYRSVLEMKFARVMS